MFTIGYMESRWPFERDARLVLVDIHTTLFGPLDLELWAYDELHSRIGPALRSTFVRMDLVVLAIWRMNVSVPGDPREVPIIPPPQKKDDTLDRGGAARQRRRAGGQCGLPDHAAQW